jgi:hypothetical protein
MAEILRLQYMDPDTIFTVEKSCSLNDGKLWQFYLGFSSGWLQTWICSNMGENFQGLIENTSFQVHVYCHVSAVLQALSLSPLLLSLFLDKWSDAMKSSVQCLGQRVPKRGQTL